MTSEQRPRRARSQYERDRRRSDPRGYPIAIEPEVTPPPSEPPLPSEVDGYDTIAPPLRALFDQVHEGQAQLVAAMERVWPLRDGDWIARIERDLAAIATSTTKHQTVLDELKPQLDRWRATTDDLAQQIPKLLALVEGLTLHVRSIDDRMRSLELDVRALTERSREHAADIQAAAEREALVIARLARLEQLERDRETTHAALAKVEQKKSRNAGGAAGGALGAIIAAAIAALAR